ncbi:MAG: 50S ribosomal protein L32 [Candidatus Latescibacteria bacterium]|nr:50S ribosomal protein L32 [Candidatus Latescibacterota bacterium]
MALPKRKVSKSRRDKRRNHWKLAAPNVVNCPHCSQPKLPHRVCPNCGYYGKREVIVSEEG